MKMFAVIGYNLREIICILNYFAELSKSFFNGNKCNAFVPTSPYRQAETVLRNHGQVIITGGPGDGKTTAAVHLITSMFDLSKCVRVNSPQSILSIDFSQTECLFFEDFCGTVAFDQVLAQAYKTELDSIRYLLNQNQIKIVFTCRTPVAAQCLSFLGRQSVFKELYVVEFSTAQLPDVEKKDILKQHLQLAGRAMSNGMIDHCLSAFNSPIGLPQCSYLFSSENKLFEKGVAFFEQPYAFLCENLDLMGKVAKSQYCFLSLILFSEYGLKRDDLMDLDGHNVFSQILKLTGISGQEIASSYLEIYTALEGVYVKYDEVEDLYTFSHDTIKEAICLSFGSRHPSLVIDFCSWGIISNYVHTVPVGRHEKVLVVPRKCHKQLAERFVQKIQAPDTYLFQIASHRVMYDPNFMDAFLEYVEEVIKPEIVLGTRDSYGSGKLTGQHSPSLMFYCAVKEHENLVFLKKIINCLYLYMSSADLYRYNLGKILMLACETGALKLYKLIIESNAPIWHSCLSAAVKTSGTEIVRHLTKHMLDSNDIEFANREILDALFIAVDNSNIELFDILYDAISSQTSFDVTLIKPSVFHRLDMSSCSDAIINAVDRFSDNVLREINLICICKIGHTDRYMRLVQSGIQICPGCLTEAVENKHIAIIQDILVRMENISKQEWTQQEKRKALVNVCLDPEWNQEIFYLLVSHCQQIPEGCLIAAVGAGHLPLVKELLQRMSASPANDTQGEKNEALHILLTERLAPNSKYFCGQAFQKQDIEMYHLLINGGAFVTEGCLPSAARCNNKTLVEDILKSMLCVHTDWVKRDKQEALRVICQDERCLDPDIIDILVEAGVKVTSEMVRLAYKKNRHFVNLLLQKMDKSELHACLKETCKQGSELECEFLLLNGAKVSRGCLTYAVRNNANVVRVILNQMTQQTFCEEWMRKEIDFALEFALRRFKYFSALQLMDAGAVRKISSDTELQNAYYELFPEEERRSSGIIDPELQNTYEEMGHERGRSPGVIVPELQNTYDEMGHEEERRSSEVIVPELQYTFFELFEGGERRNSGDIIPEMSNMALAPSITKREIQIKAMKEVCRKGDVKNYRILVEKGLKYYESSIRAATRCNCVEISDDLVKRIEIESDNSWILNGGLDSSLKNTCSNGNILLFEKLVQLGAKVSEGCLKSVVIKTPNMTLVQAVLKEMLKLPNQPWISAERNDCLLKSIKLQEPALFHSLINSGASLTNGCITKATVISDISILSSILEIIAHEPKDDWLQDDLKNAVLAACEEGIEDAFNLLIRSGGEISPKCLYFMTKRTRVSAVKTIVELMTCQPVLPWIQTEKDNALTAASLVGSKEIYTIIKEAGGKVTRGCVLAAVRGNCISIFKDILDEFDDMCFIDWIELEKESAMKLICEKGRVELYTILKTKGECIKVGCLKEAADGRHIGMMQELLKEIAHLPGEECAEYKDEIIKAYQEVRSMGFDLIADNIKQTFDKCFLQ